VVELVKEVVVNTGGGVKVEEECNRNKDSTQSYATMSGDLMSSSSIGSMSKNTYNYESNTVPSLRKKGAVKRTEVSLLLMDPLKISSSSSLLQEDCSVERVVIPPLPLTPAPQWTVDLDSQVPIVYLRSARLKQTDDDTKCLNNSFDTLDAYSAYGELDGLVPVYDSFKCAPVELRGSEDERVDEVIGLSASLVNNDITPSPPTRTRKRRAVPTPPADDTEGIYTCETVVNEDQSSKDDTGPYSSSQYSGYSIETSSITGAYSTEQGGGASETGAGQRFSTEQGGGTSETGGAEQRYSDELPPGDISSIRQCHDKPVSKKCHDKPTSHKFNESLLLNITGASFPCPVCAEYIPVDAVALERNTRPDGLSSEEGRGVERNVGSTNSCFLVTLQEMLAAQRYESKPCSNCSAKQVSVVLCV